MGASRQIFQAIWESLSLAGVLEDNCTFSIWVKPETNFALTLGGQNLTYVSGSSEYTFGNTLAAKIANYWTHLAIVSEDNSTTLYVDGRSDSGSTISDADMTITANGGETVWLDEGRVYSKSMTPGEILYLAGRVALDISGNKRHASQWVALHILRYRTRTSAQRMHQPIMWSLSLQMEAEDWATHTPVKTMAIF